MTTFAAKIGWAQAGPRSLALYALDRGDSPRWDGPEGRLLIDALTEAGYGEGDHVDVRVVWRRGDPTVDPGAGRPGWEAAVFPEVVAALAEIRQAAQAKECHEGVTRQDEFQPCERQAVALRYDPIEGKPYPVCASHTRATDAVPLFMLVAALASPAAGGAE